MEIIVDLCFLIKVTVDFCEISFNVFEMVLLRLVTWFKPMQCMSKIHLVKYSKT